MPEFTGEQKLRIVLESTIQKIPVAEQCQKYGITEKEFQGWLDHLTTNGGKIFEPGFGSSTRSSSRSRPTDKKGSFLKFFLVVSLLANLGAVTALSVYSYHKANKAEVADTVTEKVPAVDSPIHFAQPDNDFSEIEKTQADLKTKDKMEALPIQPIEPEPKDTPLMDLENLLANPIDLPKAQALPPAEILPDISSEVSFLGKVYEGRHVVYVIDVGNYLLQGQKAAERFEKVKDAVLSSLVTLSPNSYFNLVLYWNLRECSALGKTILKANRENVKLAIDWIVGLGSSVEDLKVNRNQFIPKELLYSKPLSGVVGPWFGLSLGISFDPDLIFLIAGNSPSFPMQAIPKSHFNGLDLSQRVLLNGSSASNASGGMSSIDELTRKTARIWLTSLEPPGALPENFLEIEKIALRRLGLEQDNLLSNPSVSIPWEKVFENFLGSLEVNAQMIPQSHFFLCLPEDVRWPSDLLNTAAEFAESSKGTLVENPEFR